MRPALPPSLRMLTLVCLLGARELHSQARAPEHGVRAARLAIRNATIVDGNGTPASGPADLIVVNGNPLENLKVLYPTGVDALRDGKVVKSGGVEWTIKDGIPYHAPTLLAEVKAMVAKARADRR